MARFFDSKNSTEEHDAPSGYWLTNYQVYTLAPNGAVICQETMNNFQVDNAKLEDVQVSAAPEAVAWRAKNIPLNLYLISQDEHEDYDQYMSAVVTAESEEAARHTHPNGRDVWNTFYRTWCHKNTRLPSRNTDWVNAPTVKVALIGTAVRGTKPGVILSDYKSG